MADSTLGQKKDNMSREHLVVPESKEAPKDYERHGKRDQEASVMGHSKAKHGVIRTSERITPSRKAGK